MKAVVLLSAIVCALQVRAEFYNNPPISGKRPVYTIG